MTARTILTFVCAAFVLVEARWHGIQKRDTTSICDTVFNTTNKLQCYCVKDIRESNIIRSADCFLTTRYVKPEDPVWDNFEELKSAHKLILTNSRGISWKFIPTTLFKYTAALLKLDIKYGTVDTVQSYAFANLSSVKEITLRDNLIKILEVNAFAHHKDLIAISLDKNKIEEINRDVFIDLPSLEKLFLTNNRITTLHDRAFISLTNLRELEINMNSLFSVNSETFSGLRKLQKLDLGSNYLGVIGDNTFLPLGNLRYLILESNKIQMLDEKAFNGLSKLRHLLLAHNKLTDIANIKVFENLDDLSTLSLKGNEIRELKDAVMAPILNNLYNITGSLDVDDNAFACDCQLDWFMALMNRTQSKSLKVAMENFKCIPDSKLGDTWTKIEENEKSSGQVFEDEERPGQVPDYEYYDETQLNGKLFYTDIRYLLNCTGPNYIVVPTLKTTQATTLRPITTIKQTPKSSTKVTASPKINSITTVATKLTTTPIPNTNYPNHGLLDLSKYETTATAEVKNGKSDVGEKKQSLYTTSRLATVSAKPLEDKMYEDGMASDEAKPDRLKAHRSIHQEFEDTPTIKGSAHKDLGCAVLLMACLRLLL